MLISYLFGTQWIWHWIFFLLLHFLIHLVTFQTKSRSPDTQKYKIPSVLYLGINFDSQLLSSLFFWTKRIKFSFHFIELQNTCQGQQGQNFTQKFHSTLTVSSWWWWHVPSWSSAALPELCRMPLGSHPEDEGQGMPWRDFSFLNSKWP